MGRQDIYAQVRGLREVRNLAKDTSARGQWALFVHKNGEHANLLDACDGCDTRHDAYMSAVEHTHLQFECCLSKSSHHLLTPLPPKISTLPSFVF